MGPLLCIGTTIWVGISRDKSPLHGGEEMYTQGLKKPLLVGVCTTDKTVDALPLSIKRSGFFYISLYRVEPNSKILIYFRITSILATSYFKD